MTPAAITGLDIAVAAVLVPYAALFLVPVVWLVRALWRRTRRAPSLAPAPRPRIELTPAEINAAIARLEHALSKEEP